MSLDTTAFAPQLLEIVNKSIEQSVYEKFPFLALLSKKKDFGGESWRIPVGYEDSQGGAAGFSDAQTGAIASSPLSKAFNVTHVTDYQVARISGSVIRRSEGKGSAIVEAAKYAIDSATRSLSRSIEHKLFRDGSGAIGKIASVSGSTFKMANADDITFIQVGMRLHFADDATSTLANDLRSDTALTVTAVDEDANLVTCSATMASVSAVNDDYVFRAGDRQSTTSASRICIAGFQAWIPPSTARPASSGDSFFGVDRYAHPTRLAGQYWSAGATPPEEVLIEMSHRVTRRGGSLTHVMANPSFYRALIKQMQSRGQVPLVNVEVKPNVGFRGVHVVSSESDLVVMPNVFCPADTLCGVDIDTWKLGTAGETIRLCDEDDLKMQRVSDSDTYEIRFVSEGNLGCLDPSKNINVTITPY
jgi:hypothetical protein